MFKFPFLTTFLFRNPALYGEKKPKQILKILGTDDSDSEDEDYQRRKRYMKFKSRNKNQNLKF